MMFSRSLLLALAAPLLAFAQDNGNPNPFKINGGLQATAGEPLNLEWTPTTQGTVSLILRSGSSNNLAEGTTIASKIPNSGSYSWTPDPDTTRGSDYTIEIVSDSDSSATNYTPYFVLESDNTVASSTPILSSGAPTTSLALSTASPTASPSAFPTTSNGSMTTSASGSSASSTGSSASMTSSGSSASRSSSATGSAASSASAGIQTTSASQGAAPRATAMVGMLGAVALGALAL